jgi:hypothetical protein
MIPKKKRMRRGRVLVALRALNIGGKRYSVGSLLPVDQIPERSLAAMLKPDRASARWETFSEQRTYARPTDLPPPEPPKANPAVIVIPDNDPVFSWILTRDSMRRLCNGNHALALDLLMTNVEARDLYKRAQAEACRREAKKRGVVSVGPSDLAVPL